MTLTMPTLTVAAPPTAADLAKQALSQVTALATLPEVTAKVIATVEDPKSSAAQLHAIVRHDPALVARVLKVVNSAFYGLPGQVTSIDRAIVLLGLNAIKNLAVAASLGQMFRGLQLCEKYSAKDLWAHCVAVAVVARELAKKSKPALAEEAFLGGMIHDIGILVALQVWPEQVRKLCDEVPRGGDFVGLERQIVGVTHAYLGKALAERWKFPRACQSIVAHHHTPHLAPESDRQLVALIYAADTICCHAGTGFPLTADKQTLDAEQLHAAGLTTAIVDDVRGRMTDLISAAAPLMS